VFYNGRYINPPFVWGAGGVELVAKEMTMQLQELKKKAVEHPYEWIPLVAHEVSFGYILWDKEAMEFDTTKVEGVEPDLVVRPFGRKGNNATIRKFDTGALMFHQGMFPVEIVGHKDNDGDGVIDEILEGDLSVLHIFSVALEKPYALPITTTQIDWGFKLFKDIGCATCHVPTIDTFGRVVPVSLPEDETNPWKDVFYQVDISKPPASFPIVGHGVRVDMFSDLKRHYMGKELAESTGDPLDPFFITPRLWGVADTAPYLHDSRALTLTDAIVLHGGEAAPASQKFQDLADADKIALLTFLRTLKVPKNPNSDLMDDAGGLP